MRCLLVGAGAVGQVYGYHLQRGGADVAFLVKPKHADETRRGFVLYPLKKKRVREPVQFTGFDVLTDVAEVAEQSWDCVILCVSSTALRAGDWLAELAAVIGDATLVTLQPGPEDYDFVTQRVPAERVVAGLIGLCSYAAPLPGEEVPEPGTAYWMPGFMRCPMSGPRERVTPIVETLRRGGHTATISKDVRRDLAFGSALLQTQVTALECAGWSIADLSRDKKLLRTAHRAMRELDALASRRTGHRVPLGHRLLGPRMLGLAMRIAARMAPMSMERFFQVHYTKVRDQSLAMLSRWSELADEQALPHAALDDLRHRLTE